MKHRAKGYRNEHELEQLLRAAGIPAKRIPLSGQASHTGDLIVPVSGKDVVAEVKAYRQTFFEYGLLEHSGIVFKRSIRKGMTRPWLVIMPLDMLVNLIKNEAGVI